MDISAHPKGYSTDAQTNAQSARLVQILETRVRLP